MNPIAVGLNCATGPEFMQEHVRSLANLASTAIICYPNAGLPDEEGHYHETPETLAKKLADFAAHGWLNIVGGCCGTTPDHIRAISEEMKKFSATRRHNLQISIWFLGLNHLFMMIRHYDQLWWENEQM